MLCEGNVIKLHKKCEYKYLNFLTLKLLSVTHSSAKGNRHLFRNVPTAVSQHVLSRPSCMYFLHDGNILVGPLPMIVVHVLQFRREEIQMGMEKLNILHPTVRYAFDKSS